MEHKKAIIYKAQNIINNKIYVGVTSKTLHERKKRHENSMNLGSTLYFHNAIRKYGKENFKWEIVDFVNKEKRYDEERKYIKIFNSFNSYYGYNLTYGGEGFKYLTKESRKKLSESLMGHEVTLKTREKLRQINLGKKYSKEINKKKGLSGKNNPFYGKQHSEESKDKMRKNINNIGENNPFYGKHHTEETKHKIRKKLLNKKRNKKIIEKIKNTTNIKRIFYLKNSFNLNFIIDLYFKNYCQSKIIKIYNNKFNIKLTKEIYTEFFNKKIFLFPKGHGKNKKLNNKKENFIKNNKKELFYII